MSKGDPRTDVDVFVNVVHALADRFANQAEVLEPYGLQPAGWQRIVDEWLIRLTTDAEVRRRFEAAYAALEAGKNAPTKFQRGVAARVAAAPADPVDVDETSAFVRPPLSPPLPFDPRAQSAPPPAQRVEPSQSSGDTVEIKRAAKLDPSTTLPFKGGTRDGKKKT